MQWTGVNKNANSQINLIFVGAFHPRFTFLSILFCFRH